MDDDDLRRGRPTCHRAFGEDVAILAGDALYGEAFALLLARQEAAPEHLLAAALELARASGSRGMVAGQYIDDAATAHVGPTGLRRLHELKTGRLIAASVTCVLLLAGVDDPQMADSFTMFARELRILFQIVDDTRRHCLHRNARQTAWGRRSTRQAYVCDRVWTGRGA
jgi:geranylgeranyl diphosphate synthase, type II